MSSITEFNMEAIYRDCVAKLDWWEYNLEPVCFKTETDLNNFLSKLDQILYDFEGNKTLEITTFTNMYNDYKNQNHHSFVKFYSRYQPNMEQYSTKNNNCTRRSQLLKELLIQKLGKEYPEIINKYSIASSIFGTKILRQLETECDDVTLDHAYIRDFAPHVAPFIKVEINGKIGVILMEILIYIDKPILIFQGENLNYERYDGVTQLSYETPNYIRLTRLINGEVKYNHVLFIGGSLIQLQNTFKLACLPAIAIHKILFVDKISQIFVRGFAAKCSFKIDRVVKLGNTFEGTVTKVLNVPTKYFTGDLPKDSEIENEIYELSIQFGENREEFLSFFKQVAKLNADEVFVSDMQKILQTISRLSYDYVDLYMPKKIQ